MQMHRQELLSSANRRIRRGRKTTGRIVVSALGFGLAYYFDTENGAARRKRLQQFVQRTARNIESGLAPEVGEPPAVFPPVLRTHRPESQGPGPSERIEAAR
jgi:hypothetical protein